MPTTLETLATELGACRPIPSSKGYPRELRARVVVAATLARARGATIAEVSTDLGLPSASLQRWLKASPTPSPPPRPAFVPVVVEPDDPGNGGRTTSLPQAAPVALSLVSPGGYRVEGLDLDSLVALLGQLP